MTALSKQSPTEPIDGSRPESVARRVNAQELNLRALVTMNDGLAVRPTLVNSHAQRVRDQRGAGRGVD
jgi:hypothetical protein